MEKLFDIILKNRRVLHRILEETPKAQLVKIPDGFRNNIWWNIAHVVVTQQLLVYKRSGLQMRIPKKFIDPYKKGSVPEGVPTDAEIMEISAFLLSTVSWMEEDYKAGLFQNFDTYTTSLDVTLNSVEDAIAFNTFHEGLHFGSVLALRKAVK